MFGKRSSLLNNVKRTAVFLAGGSGITPFRSIVFRAAEEKLSHRILPYSTLTADRDGKAKEEEPADDMKKLLDTLSKDERFAEHS